MNGKVKRIVSLSAAGILAASVMCACAQQDLEDMTTKEGTSGTNKMKLAEKEESYGRS